MTALFCWILQRNETDSAAGSNPDVALYVQLTVLGEAAGTKFALAALIN
jgi:hypothetical protein